jgi:hypothetical protein
LSARLDSPNSSLKIKLVPFHAANLGATLAGQDQKFDDRAERKSKRISRAPNKAQFVKRQDEIADRFS